MHRHQGAENAVKQRCAWSGAGARQKTALPVEERVGLWHQSSRPHSGIPAQVTAGQHHASRSEVARLHQSRCEVYIYSSCLTNGCKCGGQLRVRLRLWWRILADLFGGEEGWEGSADLDEEEAWKASSWARMPPATWPASRSPVASCIHAKRFPTMPIGFGYFLLLYPKLVSGRVQAPGAGILCGNQPQRKCKKDSIAFIGPQVRHSGEIPAHEDRILQHGPGPPCSTLCQKRARRPAALRSGCAPRCGKPGRRRRPRRRPRCAAPLAPPAGRPTALAESPPAMPPHPRDRLNIDIKFRTYL